VSASIETEAPSPEPRAANPRALVAWCVFDWANSAFPTVIVTFVFSAYFASAVAENATEGTAQWGHAVSLSALAIGILSPIFGAIADASGRRKPWLFGFTAACAVLTAALWFARPEPSYALYALVMFALANAAFEIATVFYNAMLPALVPPARMGRISGWGWGLGYLGGLACLVAVLFGLVQADPPPFGLDPDAAEPVRAAAILVSVWLVVFAVPIFLFTPDAPASGLGAGAAVRRGLAQLVETARRIRQYGNIARFLIARLLYIDGLDTLFAFGGIYAAGSFGMTTAEIITFGIAINVTAGLGAAAFAWVDDAIGAKRTILIALVGLVAFGTPLLFAEGKFWFWALALPLGIFFGPAQAASRSLMARLAPPQLSAEMFGLFALSGRATAFLGPAALAWATLAFDSQRAGMATVLIFIVAGFVLLIPVREARP
jgi:UMF1 family MFS transporter